MRLLAIYCMGLFGSAALAYGQTLTASTTSSTFGSPVTFFCNVGAPGVSVDFYDNGAVKFTSVTPVKGAASWTVSDLAPGQHGVTAKFVLAEVQFITLGPLAVTVGRAPVSMSLTPSPNPQFVNQTVTLTATVTGSVAGIAATGSVTFMDGSNPPTTQTLQNGVATYSTSFSNAANHTLTATYPGDSHYLNGSASAVEPIIPPAKQDTQTQLTPGTNSVIATVSPAGATGSVQFTDNGNPMVTLPLAGGTATAPTTSLVPGQHAIVAKYLGDSNFNGSTSNFVNLTINPPKRDTQTQLTPGTNSVIATVTPAGATGLVQFTDNGNPMVMLSLAGGTATAPTTSLVPGQHAIVAKYLGDTNFNGSTSNFVNLTINPPKQNTQTALSPGTNSVIATVTPAGATGTVQFTDNSSPMATVSLAGGTATAPTAGLAPGSHTIVANYLGDANFNASTSNSVNLSVKQNTQTVLSQGTNSVIATVTPAGATGTVQFTDNGSPMATVLLAGGTATAPTAGLAPGSHTIVGSYSGDSNFNGSNSNSLSIDRSKPSTQTVLSQGTNSVIATVTPAGATGTVQFTDNGSPMATVSLAGGTATAPTAGLAPGSHTIVGSYSGDSNFNGSNSNSLSIDRSKPSTQTVLSQGTNSVIATVTPAGATGTVQFTDNGSPMATVPLAGGTATAPTAGLAPGSHTIVASYSGDTNFNGSISNPVNLNIKQNSQTMLSQGTNSVIATVTPAGATGTVAFTDNGNPMATVSLAGGTATAPTTGLAPGQHAILATYSGDTNVNGSISNPVNLNIKQNSQTMLSQGTNSVIATVTPAGATGTVAFTDNGNPIATVSLAGGTATAPTTGLAPGQHAILATYSGDTNVNGSISNPVNLNIKQNSQTMLSQGTNSVIATVTPAGATGTVAFTDNGNPIATVSLAGGTATAPTTGLAPGQHAILATYSGDTNVNGSISNPVNVTISPTVTQTQLLLTVTPTSSTFGQSVILRATLSPAAATGNITFTDGNGNSTLNSTTASGGAATFSISTLAVGTHPLMASFAADSPFTNSSSQTVNLQVGKAATATVLTFTPAAPKLGDAVVLTAKVTPAAATGSVRFLDGTTTLGTMTLQAGSATFTPPTFGPGTHTLTAVYSGDASFDTSTGTAVPLSPGLTASITTLSATPLATNVGQAVNFAATVSPATATGTVTFLEAGATLGTGNLKSGAASFTTSALPAGVHSVVARYDGDNLVGSSPSQAVSVTVNKINSSVSLSVSANTAKAGSALTLTAAVTPSSATGSITFFSDGQSLGTNPLNSGRASVTTTEIPAGTHNLLASYSGDNNTTPGNSTPVSLVVTADPTPLGKISPASLPTAIVGMPYSQSLAVTGGSGSLTWTLSSGSVPGVTLSSTGVLAGTPTSPATTSLAVQVTDGNSTASAVLSLTVLQMPAVSISAPVVNSTADQPIAQATVSPVYPMPLTATFALSFTPNAAGLPANYVNPSVQFINGSSTSGPIAIPANSEDPVMLPPIQVGTVAGTINVRLASLTTADGRSVLPPNATVSTITVGRFVPSIVAGSVKIMNLSSTGFSVVLDGISTPRDLTSASLTFAAASGTQLNGAQMTVSLAGAATAWFPDAAPNRGVANGGAFSLTIPFNYSGDTSVLSGVSVTLSNSAGVSAAVTGGK